MVKISNTKMYVECINTAMVTMVRIAKVKNSQIFLESVMVIMVKIFDAKKLACSSGTAMVTMVRISNVNNRQTS